MNFIRHICKDTFDQCLVMIKPQQKKEDHGYSTVGREMKEEAFHHDDEEDDESFSAWPSKSTAATTASASSSSVEKRNTTVDTEDPSPGLEKRPMLIGNIDEENLMRKNDVDDADDLFKELNAAKSSPTIKISKTVIDSKKGNKNVAPKDRMDKFKMEDDIEAHNDGWIDDDDIKI